MISDACVPNQYIYRAFEAKKILSVTDSDPKEVAKRIAVAELGQMIFFVVQAVLYSLAFAGIITPMIAGIVSAVLIPLEAYFSYQTFVHFKPISRILLTIAAIATLTLCAGFALFGIVRDSAITLCAGGVLLHLFRNISECIDARNAHNDKHYREEVLNEPPQPQPNQKV